MGRLASRIVRLVIQDVTYREWLRWMGAPQEQEQFLDQLITVAEEAAAERGQVFQFMERCEDFERDEKMGLWRTPALCPNSAASGKKAPDFTSAHDIEFQ